MSTKVSALVWQGFRKGGSQQLAMLSLADWCNDRGAGLNQTVRELAQRINVTEKSARRILHGFVEQGLLALEGNEGGGAPGQGCVYRLCIEKLEAGPTTPAQRSKIFDGPLDESHPAEPIPDQKAGRSVAESEVPPHPDAAIPTPPTHGRGPPIDPSHPWEGSAPLTPPTDGRGRPACARGSTKPTSTTKILGSAFESAAGVKGESAERGKPENGKRRGRAPMPPITFAQFCAQCAAQGEDTVPAGDPVFGYAKKIRLPPRFLSIAWSEFEHRYARSDRKQVDWRAYFRNHIRENWLKLWFHDERTGSWSLTTRGVQAERVLEADEKAAS